MDGERATDVLLRRVRAYIALHGDEVDGRTLTARAAMAAVQGWTPSGQDHKARRLALRAVEELVELADAEAAGRDDSQRARLARAALAVAEDEHGELDDPAFMHALALWLMRMQHRDRPPSDEHEPTAGGSFDEELRRWLEGG